MLDNRTIKSDLDPNLALGIDPGLNNWLACVDNLGNRFLVDGFHVKSLTQNYINADLNGAANILRKANVNMKLGLNLTRMDRRCLTTVARCRLWSLKNSLRPAKESPSL